METVDYGNPAYQNDYENECRECGEPCDGDWCSGSCFEASLR